MTTVAITENTTAVQVLEDTVIVTAAPGVSSDTLSASVTAHNALATAHGLTADISAGLTAANNPGAGNPIMTDSAVAAELIAAGLLAALPVSIDFSTRPDGPLPLPFFGATWQVDTGKLINVPTVGTNLLTDPGLEANYTGGKCDTLIKSGSPSLSQSADVHGGSKAQQFQATASNDSLQWSPVTAKANQWYRFSAWSKRLSGTANDTAIVMAQTGAVPESMVAEVASATYIKHAVSILSTTTNGIIAAPAWEYGSSNFASIVSDDATLEALQYASLFCLTNSGLSDVTVQATPDVLVDHTLFGLVIRADVPTAPNNCIMVLLRSYSRFPGYAFVYVIKKIGSTYAIVSAGGLYVTTVSNAKIEARMVGSTLKIYYNNAQAGADITISDSELASGTCVGLFSTGSNLFKSFFIVAP